MDLELLNNAFPVRKNPGLDTLDPRFVDLAGMVQEGKFSTAALEARKIIEEEIYDVRIITYFLYGFFDEFGPKSFKNIFHSMGMVFCENWEAIGPLKNRTKHARNSLSWFFKQANKSLENEEKKKRKKWRIWQEDTSPADIQEALEISRNLGTTIEDVLEKQSVTVVDGLAKLTAWLDSYYRLIYREPETKQIRDSATQEESISIEIESEPGPQKATLLKGADDLQNGMESPPLQLLLKKMTAFEQLLEENKKTGAALVANDINQTIRNFDPQIYFPSLFAKFTRLFALNTEELLAFDGCRDTAVWLSMEKLYHVDMESFISLDNGFHAKDPDSFHGAGQKNSLQNGSNETHANEETGYDDDGDDY